MKRVSSSPAAPSVQALVCRAFALSLLAVFLLFLAEAPGQAARPQSADSEFGVGLVPFQDAGDEVEKQLYRIVGSMPQIDREFVINDGEHMLQTLIKIGQMGKKINYLVIAGHGSRDTPGIKFAKDDMIPEEVDLDWNLRQLEALKRAQANPALVKATPESIAKELAETERRIPLLRQVSDVMAKDAVVLLINCSAAGTPKGVQFINNFGKVLLSKRGGVIIASRKDVILRERLSLLQSFFAKLRTGESVDTSSVLVDADWQHFRIVGTETDEGPAGPVSTDCPDLTGDWILDIGNGEFKIRWTIGPVRKNPRSLSRPYSWFLTQTIIDAAKGDTYFRGKSSGTILYFDLKAAKENKPPLSYSWTWIWGGQENGNDPATLQVVPSRDGSPPTLIIGSGTVLEGTGSTRRKTVPFRAVRVPAKRN